VHLSDHDASGTEVGFHFLHFCVFCQQAAAVHHRAHASSTQKPPVFFFHTCQVQSNPRLQPSSSTNLLWSAIHPAAVDFKDGRVGDPVHWLFPSPSASAQAPLPSWLPYRTDDLGRRPFTTTTGDSSSATLAALAFRTASRRAREEPVPTFDPDEVEVSPEEREWEARLVTSPRRRVRRRLEMEPEPAWTPQVDGFDLSFSSNDRVQYGMLSRSDANGRRALDRPLR
jgi:hypothetical protein